MRQVARIAPSILAADFARLGAEVATVEPYVDWLHVDVMDGHFVPNLSLGIPVIASLAKVTDLPLDCHMMTTNPHAYLGALRDAGAWQVTVHIEAYPDPTAVAARTREEGLCFGLVLNPPTPVEALVPYVELCDTVLVMSVNPGFGGQRFLDATLAKVEVLRKSIDSGGLTTDIEIDGGIGPATAKRARDAGADVFVAGTSIFGADDPVAAIAELRRAIDDRR